MSFGGSPSLCGPRGSAAALLSQRLFNSESKGLPPTICLLGDEGWNPSQPSDRLELDQQDVMWHMPGVTYNGTVILLAPLTLSGWIGHKIQEDMDAWAASEPKLWSYFNILHSTGELNLIFMHISYMYKAKFQNRPIIIHFVVSWNDFNNISESSNKRQLALLICVAFFWWKLWHFKKLIPSILWEINELSPFSSGWMRHADNILVKYAFDRDFTHDAWTWSITSSISVFATVSSQLCLTRTELTGQIEMDDFHMEATGRCRHRSEDALDSC